MKYRICISALLLWAGMQLSASNNQEEVVIKIIETSDVHGNFFPYNFIERKEWSGSLARVHSFAKEQREKYGDNCLLMDNGISCKVSLQLTIIILWIPCLLMLRRI